MSGCLGADEVSASAIARLLQFSIHLRPGLAGSAHVALRDCYAHVRSYPSSTAQQRRSSLTACRARHRVLDDLLRQRPAGEEAIAHGIDRPEWPPEATEKPVRRRGHAR